MLSATAENRQDELKPDTISRRLMPLNFAAIHRTTLTIANCPFDLISSNPSRGCLESMREEATRILAEDGGRWTYARLERFHRVNPTICEDVRALKFMIRGLMRKASPMEGIRNKVEGWTAPQGAFLGVGVHSVLHDPEIYPDPEAIMHFDFRGSKKRLNK